MRYCFREHDLCIFNAKTYWTLCLFNPSNWILFPHLSFSPSLTDDKSKKFFINLGPATQLSLKSKWICCSSTSGEETMLSSSNNTTVESSTTDIDYKNYFRSFCNRERSGTVSVILENRKRFREEN